MSRHLLLAFSIPFVACFLLLMVLSPSSYAAPISQEGGEEYIVQEGESLYEIAANVYGNGLLWPRIFAGTNAKARVDASFTVITNPAELAVGQKLWIPDIGTGQPATEEITQEISVRFVQPLDGAVVSPTVEVETAATGLTVEAAGDVHEGSGHMHVLVDTDYVPAGEIIPRDDEYIHYWQGELTGTLELEPGEHVLRLQFSDGAHFALEGDQYRETITVTVVAGEAGLTETVDGGPSIAFVEPQDGATVSPTFDVAMEATGLTVEPSGEIHEGAGHMHILVDTDFVEPGEVILFDEQHLHFGQGQLTSTLTLTPGVHVLGLQFANGGHIALEGDQYRDTITVTVAAGGATMTDTVDGGPSVAFVEPQDGATVSPTFDVAMEATGLTVEPSGEIHEGAGHMHILVDTDFIEPGEVILFDEQHLHFGQGQLTSTLTLTPGVHVLGLQFANGGHIALDGDQYRDSITVTVAAE